ncbi:glycosyltransferase family 9 protein [Candidatus Binatus sp.]|uniref:glycosyltransferase family 9 protein n=1 Tax=Candidatus Binatus sp. TaxID=2811406 RepID=UPI002F945CAD
MTPHERIARSIRRVLVIFPGALGDLMCLMPALGAIARRHPGACVELMARLELARLAAGRTVVARGHSIEAREVGALFTDDTSGDARRFFADFDRIYSFFASDDWRFRARLAAATDGHVSFHPFRPGGDGHVSAAYLRAIEIEIDAAASPVYQRLEPTPDDLAAAARAIEQSGCAGSNLIVIFPGSGSPGKNWPAHKFAALASMLSLSDHAGVAVILGPAEISLEPIFRQSGVVVLKQLDLPTVTAIARVASAFVGNDSGVSHLAAAAGASGVAIFGPTDPARWRPLAPGAGGRIEVLRRNPIDSIEADEVAGALSKFVAQRQN